MPGNYRYEMSGEPFITVCVMAGGVFTGMEPALGIASLPQSFTGKMVPMSIASKTLSGCLRRWKCRGEFAHTRITYPITDEQRAVLFYNIKRNLRVPRNQRASSEELTMSICEKQRTRNEERIKDGQDISDS